MNFLPVIQPSGGGGERTNVLPLAALHLRAQWHPAPVHSFTLPLWYAGTYDEQQAARERAVIFDRSYLGRFYVTGERAADLLARVFATDTRRIPVGAIRRGVVCRVDGTIFDIPTLYHLDEGRWFIVSGPRAQTALMEAIEAETHPGHDVEVRDRLPGSVLLAVHGPEAAQRLEAVIGQTIPTAVPAGEAHEMLLGGYRALVAHHSELGEDGYEFLVSPEVGEHLWENALTAGIEPAGLAAYDTMRLEVGVIEAPTETPPPATPLHTGLGALVDLSDPDGSPRAFYGAEALRQVPATPERVLVGLRIEGKRLAKRGSRVTTPAIAGGRDIGACVNAVYSPVLGTGIALAYLPPGLARVEVDTDGVPQPATVVPLPFFDGPRGASGAGA